MKHITFQSFSAATVLASLWLSGCATEQSDVAISDKKQDLSSVGGLNAELHTLSEWATGYCGEVRLRNDHSTEAVSAWQVDVDLAGASLQNAWSAVTSVAGGTMIATPENWNANINPGEETSFGFCVNRSSAAIVPSVVAVTDNLPSDATEDLVELVVSDVDDFLYLTVNGLRSQVVPYQGGGGPNVFDVSRWFTNGVNDARIQIANTGGPASYAVQLRVNGVIQLEEACSGDYLTGELGIIGDHQLDVELEHSPEATLVNIDSPDPGALYVNDQFMGVETPASLLLPPGEYVLGLGQGSGVMGDTSAQFVEETLTVSESQINVQLSQDAPLPVQNHTRVAVLPVRETYHGSDADIGVLSNDDIALMESQTQATSDAFVLPNSYGLTDWDVTILPTVENVPMLRDASPTSAPQTTRLLTDTGQLSLQDEYDVVVFLYSTHHADGGNVDNGPCCAWAGGNHVMYQTAWLRDFTSPGQPGEALYHEVLHVMDWYNKARFQRYTGLDAIHGAEIHGYQRQTNGYDWTNFYRDLVRGQVAELSTMRLGDKLLTPPETADLYVGLFETSRYGSRP